MRYGYNIEQGNAVGSAWGTTKERRGTITTQADGTFAVTNLHGHWFSILGLEKVGYKRANQITREEISFNYDRVEPTHFTPDKANPVIFPMVQDAALEPLIVHEMRWNQALALPAAGAPILWDVWQGKPNANGELRITFQRDPVALSPGQKPARWKAMLEMIGGGIMEEQAGSEIFIAPNDTYPPVIDYPQQPQRLGRPDQRFYFRTAKGNFGRLEVTIYPNDEGSTARCFIKAYLNPQPGSRNLEYDKTKRQKVAASTP